MLSVRQNQLYWREWNNARTTLLQKHGFSREDANAERKEIHNDLFGSYLSSKDLTNAQFSKVLGAFRAISNPSDAKAQVKANDDEAIRLRWKIETLRKELGLHENYIHAVANNIAKTTYDLCSVSDLKKILAALNYHKKRQRKEAHV